jgi:hypothetical protein
MHDHIPSKTALRVAMRRAVHQIVDDPKILDDPLALAILGEDGPRAFERLGTDKEVETRVNGKSRDLTIDAAGALVSVEEPVWIDAIPAAAKAAIEKLAVGGKIKSVESVTKGQTVTYEAVIVKGLKKSEVVVAADGSVQK